MDFNYKKELAKHKVSYLGGVATSAKIEKSLKVGTMTYCLYLAPADLSGYNVCPVSRYCRANCLNESGHNMADVLAGSDRINQARIRKTKWFFEDRDTFMRCLIYEIKNAKKRAEKLGYDFSIRLNGTSDLSPELFVNPDNGMNVLEEFPFVQFYDYTKVPARIALPNKYENYFLVFSYNGYNWGICEKYLKQGGNVAVVFRHELPEEWNGYKVIDGNNSDTRYQDNTGCIVGLHYHKTANDYQIDENGIRRFVEPTSKFIVRVGE